MEAYMHALRLRLRDAAHSCWTATFPSDRPSGAYSMFTCLVNGGLLVWSCAVVFSHTCETVVGRWVYAGMAHCFINMSFCVMVMMLIRRQIAAGISEETSQWRFCCSNHLIIAYVVYLVWVVVWMITVGQISARHPRTVCVSHLNVQVAFFALYLLIGVVLFYSTFITELCRRPRWRHFAAMRYNYHRTQALHNSHWNDVNATAGEDGEPVELVRIGVPRLGATEHTTTMDYASVMDDSVTATAEDRDSHCRAFCARRRAE
ncbi:hypothetical protein LSCM1_04984 [Leishmania martiniquensis]|uniref:Uncharacterized protein n=1 Tax=Leishmania martiniquensis TaxID=1580590 RepID=A0A836H4Y9_9TRYP|nr:hypothetical protein LSCM1_04984 [Leishmania martiniquensis]